MARWEMPAAAASCLTPCSQAPKSPPQGAEAWAAVCAEATMAPVAIMMVRQLFA
jgi:hypothetical protein